MQCEGVASAARRMLCHVFSMLLLPRMREVDLGCGKALLIKESGEFHAVGHKCPHYGAPLVKGQSASHPRRLRASKCWQKTAQCSSGCAAGHGVVPCRTLSIILASSRWGKAWAESWGCRNLLAELHRWSGLLVTPACHCWSQGWGFFG